MPKLKTCYITGSRHYPKEKEPTIRKALQQELLQAVKDGCTHFVTSLSNELEMLCAKEVVSLRRQGYAITLEAILPYRSRLQARSAPLHQLLTQCDAVGVLSDSYTGKSCLLRCHRYLVGQSSKVIALYDGREKGGVVFAMRLAYTLGMEVCMIRIE